MTILVTGCAGFIGFHVARALLKRGDRVIGIDNLNDYYDVTLKKARLSQLQAESSFEFQQINIAHWDEMHKLIKAHPQIQSIVHLAAQAGVRYSLTNPFAYAETNLVGQLSILEACRALTNLKHLVYASSSSVYGANTKLPFSVEDRVDKPMSLYAATKKSGELMTHSYCHLFRFPCTGLRYFTVYGPWGRPDMCAFIFADAILKGRKMPVYNNGDMKRNFTYIDDIVEGTLSALDTPPRHKDHVVPHRLYNLGNDRTECLMDFIHVMEQELGKKAKISFEPIQPGDVKETVADIERTTQALGFTPKVNIQQGVKEFVRWYQEYYHVQ